MTRAELFNKINNNENENKASIDPAAMGELVKTVCLLVGANEIAKQAEDEAVDAGVEDCDYAYGKAYEYEIDLLYTLGRTLQEITGIKMKDACRWLNDRNMVEKEHR